MRPHTPSPDQDDAPDLGVLTGRLMRAIQEELFATLAERGHPEVRPRHGTVLAHLDPRGVRATDLAERSGQHKQLIGTIVDELDRLGYIRREPDPADRRAKLIVPTERGQDEITTARAVLAAIELRHRSALGSETYAVFKDALARITEDQRRWKTADAEPERP
ncbi:MarR family winged helix-turn-helix transcriptional regulator [Spirillospora sp. NPDC050679]